MMKILERWRREPSVDVRRLFLLSTLRSWVFYVPVIVIYNKEIMQVDFAGFMLAEALFAFGMVILEIPTGYLSDIWQRRVTLIMSAIFWAAGTFGMLIAQGLFQAICVQLVMAVGASFSSGTVQAMLYEYLAEEGRESEFRKVEGQRFAYGFYVLAGTSLLAGLLYKVNPYLPVVLSCVTQFIGVALAFKLREPVRQMRGVERNAFRDMMQTMRYALYGHKEIAAIILLAAVMMAGTKMILWVQQPYFEAAGIPVAWFGLLSTFACVLIGLSSQLAHKLERWLRPVALLGVLLLCEAGLTLLTGSAALMIFAPLLLVGQALYGVANPVLADIISQRAEPERRATILSAQSLMYQLTFSVMNVPYGWIAEHKSVPLALWALTAALLVMGIPAWLFLRQRVGKG